jgi:hypothetical protein
MKKLTTAQKIAPHINHLKEKNYPELVAWAKENGIDSASGMAAYRKALAAAGINYEALKSDYAAKKEAVELNKKNELFKACDGKSITLITDANVNQGRFAICAEDGAPLWYGRFFDEAPETQPEAELNAVLKAIWLAHNWRAHSGNPRAVHLIIKTDAEFMIHFETPGTLCHKLKKQADKYNVYLEIEHIPGKENPADKYTKGNGYKKHTENDFNYISELFFD